MANGAAVEYRRLLIDLAHVAPDARVLGVAAELASILGLDLMGLFVEDQALHGFAGLPFARELRMPSLAWAPVQPEQMAAAFAHAAAQARRILEGESARLGLATRFEVMRGEVTVCVSGQCETADIVVLGLPVGVAARSIGSFARVWKAARHAPGAVLLLPGRIARHRGPIVALAGPEGASSLAMAARIARAAGEELVVLLPPEQAADGAMLARLGEAAGLPAERLHIVALHRRTPEAVEAALTRWRERLLILGRQALADADDADDGLLRLAGSQGVPILVR